MAWVEPSQVVRQTRLVYNIFFLECGVDMAWWKGWVQLWRILWIGDNWVLAEAQIFFVGREGQTKQVNWLFQVWARYGMLQENYGLEFQEDLPGQTMEENLGSLGNEWVGLDGMVQKGHVCSCRQGQSWWKTGVWLWHRQGGHTRPVQLVVGHEITLDGYRKGCSKSSY